METTQAQPSSKQKLLDGKPEPNIRPKLIDATERGQRIEVNHQESRNASVLHRSTSAKQLSSWRIVKLVLMPLVAIVLLFSLMAARDYQFGRLAFEQHAPRERASTSQPQKTILVPQPDETYEQAFDRVEGGEDQASHLSRQLQEQDSTHSLSGQEYVLDIYGGNLDISQQSVPGSSETVWQKSGQSGSNLKLHAAALLRRKQHTRPGLGQSESQAAHTIAKEDLEGVKGYVPKQKAPSAESLGRSLAAAVPLRRRTRLNAKHLPTKASTAPTVPSPGMDAFGETWTAGNVAGTPLQAPVSAEEQTASQFDRQTLALLEARNISAVDPNACGQLLNISKIAVMFLTRGELFHEATWAAWFRHAAGLYPLQQLCPTSCPQGNASCGCNDTLARAANKLCAPLESQNVLRQQHLFSVYIHPLPSFGAYPEDSIFHGREISERVQVEWGSHELVDAARNLLKAALQDPRNKKFIQLSESGIPLYPPAAVHYELLAEEKSRMDSCGIGRTDPWRYSGRMGMNIRNHWRKSSQWVALTRKHAELIVEDTDFYPKFQSYCHNAYDHDYNRWRDCFSDEHYAPSLIAYLQLGHETDCIGGLVSVDWSRGGAHPKMYRAGEVNAKLLIRLRESNGKCNASQLIRESGAAYVAAGQAGSVQLCNATCFTSSHNMVTGYECPLFARKFPQQASDAVFNLVKDCNKGLLIVNDGMCANNIPEQRVVQDRNLRLLRGMTYV